MTNAQNKDRTVVVLSVPNEALAAILALASDAGGTVV